METSENDHAKKVAKDFTDLYGSASKGVWSSMERKGTLSIQLSNI